MILATLSAVFIIAIAGHNAVAGSLLSVMIFVPSSEAIAHNGGCVETYL